MQTKLSDAGVDLNVEPKWFLLSIGLATDTRFQPFWVGRRGN